MSEESKKSSEVDYAAIAAELRKLPQPVVSMTPQEYTIAMTILALARVFEGLASRA